jgi:hypothetical protein
MAKAPVGLSAKDVEKWTRLARSDQPAFRTLSPARQFRSSARTFDLGRQYARSCRAGGISQGLTSCAEGLGRGCNFHGVAFSANFPTEWSRRRSPASYVDRIASRLAHFFTTVGLTRVLRVGACIGDTALYTVTPTTQKGDGGNRMVPKRRE